jgi:hypothetical protein
MGGREVGVAGMEWGMRAWLYWGVNWGHGGVGGAWLVGSRVRNRKRTLKE